MHIHRHPREVKIPGFNHRLDGVKLPNLRSLTFGSNFNQSLDGVSWLAESSCLWDSHAWQPCSIDLCMFQKHQVDLPKLRSLTFGEHFNQSLQQVILPPFLEHLTFGYRFNEALQGVDLPKSLRSLTFGSLFNRSLEEVVLPMDMETLTFGFCFNHSDLDHKYCLHRVSPFLLDNIACRLNIWYFGGARCFALSLIKAVGDCHPRKWSRSGAANNISPLLWDFWGLGWHLLLGIGTFCPSLSTSVEFL